MAISSEFYRDLSKIEKKIFKVSKRQLRGYTFLALAGVVLMVEALVFPDWAFFVFSFPTALILGTYPILVLLNRWKEKKRRILLYFYYEERSYLTGQIRRYTADEFRTDEHVQETDTF